MPHVFIPIGSIRKQDQAFGIGKGQPPVTGKVRTVEQDLGAGNPMKRRFIKGRARLKQGTCIKNIISMNLKRSKEEPIFYEMWKNICD